MTTQMSVSADVTRQIVTRQIAEWQMSYENLRIACIVHTDLGDKARTTELAAEMAKCVKAVERLQAMLPQPPAAQE